MMPKKITIWECPIHGETEVMEELEEAYCPKCGKKMSRKNGYTEE